MKSEILLFENSYAGTFTLAMPVDLASSTPEGVEKTTLAGGMPIVLAPLSGARGITVDNNGNLFVGITGTDFHKN